MDILLNHVILPDHGEVELKFDRKFTINISAEQARRQVNRWLLLEVSTMIGAEAPTLVLKDSVVWRVPAVFTAPHVGAVGVVGTIEVDVQTGQMNNTPDCKALIEQCAQKLATRLPPYPDRREVSIQYWAKDKLATRTSDKAANPILDFTNASSH